MQCNICHSNNNLLVRREIHKPDRFELALDIPKVDYIRRWVECTECEVAINIHGPLTASRLGQIEDQYYSIDFPNGDLKSKYKKIMGLHSDASDNAGRVKRVQTFISEKLTSTDGLKLVDVGAGLGVFLSLLCDTSPNTFEVSAVETDPIAAAHLRSLNKFKVYEGYLENLTEENVDLITVNKVLEHIKDPIMFLRLCRKKLHRSGLIYVEVPDISGLDSLPDNDNILGALHYNLYSTNGLKSVLSLSGFTVTESRKLIEPSGKITCFAFARVV